jgi:hypothetical protein
MLAFEMSEKKVISDICTKLQLPVKAIVPIFKLDQTEEYLRNLDMEKLREQVLKEQERLEKGVREAKNRKLRKWKKLK